MMMRGAFETTWPATWKLFIVLLSRLLGRKKPIGRTKRRRQKQRLGQLTSPTAQVGGECAPVQLSSRMSERGPRVATSRDLS